MNEKMKPMRNFVLCRTAVAKPEKTAGGVHVPDTVRGRPDRAEVLAVGEGYYTAKGIRVPCCVKPGDQVIFNPYEVVWAEGVAMNINSKLANHDSLFMIFDSSILCVIEPD